MQTYMCGVNKERYMIGEQRGRIFKTTQTSLRVLELVIKHEGLSLSELNDMIDKPKSTLYNHLTTLEECRYLVREGDTYEQSFRLALLGDQTRRRTKIDEVSTDIVKNLADRTGEEVNFSVLEHGRLLIVQGASDRSETKNIDYRTEYYLHNTAAGKAILAEMDREHVQHIIDEWGMPKETEATITDPDQLFEELSTIAERGYSVVDEEFAPGLVSVGAPVHKDGTIIGGLSVGGPKYRLDTARIRQDIADALLDAVDTFERELTV